MDTLTEVEEAADRLSVPGRWALARHLEAGLKEACGDSAVDPRLAEWMRRLKHLRESGNTGTVSMTSEQILDELRAE